MSFFSENDPVIWASSDVSSGGGGGGGGGAGGDPEMMVATVESVVQAAIILLVGVAIFVANVLVLASLLMTPSLRDPMTYYLISLAVCDLLCGVFVVPLSVYPALVREWMYGEVICRLEGYLEVTLCTVTIYTLMWIGVDRYVAVRKPLRYETLQTKTRCQCSMLFSWVTAALLCSPPLLGMPEPAFYKDACICMLDWSWMVPYGVTLACLVLGPSLLTILYTYSYVFRTIRRARRNRRRISLMHDMRTSSSSAAAAAAAACCVTDKETALQTETLGNPHNGVAFALLALFWVSWAPLVSLLVYEGLMADKESLDVPMLRFFFTWLGILNCFWKALVYILLSAQFRASLRLLVDACCCCCRAGGEKGSARRRRQQLQSTHESSDASTFDGLR